MDDKRRPARKQALPETEIKILLTLQEDELFTRVRSLFEEGWPLQSIGNAFNPPRVRSTVKSWVTRPHDLTPIFPPVPKPKYRSEPRGYVSRRPVSPGIDGDTRAHISSLAPLARRYRSGMLENAPAAIANAELEKICRELNARNVSVKELAEAAGVTYRAMARRLGK